MNLHFNTNAPKYTKDTKVLPASQRPRWEAKVYYIPNEDVGNEKFVNVLVIILVNFRVFVF